MQSRKTSSRPTTLGPAAALQPVHREMRRRSLVGSCREPSHSSIRGDAVSLHMDKVGRPITGHLAIEPGDHPDGDPWRHGKIHDFAAPSKAEAADFIRRALTAWHKAGEPVPPVARALPVAARLATKRHSAAEGAAPYLLYFVVVHAAVHTLAVYREQRVHVGAAGSGKTAKLAPQKTPSEAC
jgi:hypothetical protein